MIYIKGNRALPDVTGSSLKPFSRIIEPASTELSNIIYLTLIFQSLLVLRDKISR